ncbi:DUF421 domain-containing protein [Cellulosimicrobium marinum]|uniref:DUF421 domain-containing protein n=1 Tax=Cellulosimicrobium marinum TaxID=1638992 RepID=UPI001E50A09F|nr:YetF domain-containing protein [Cellulosimicrobium marinum]MCB7135844.1 DUF421 domain-containing protein [Cellulosimicrobium marinum]
MWFDAWSQVARVVLVGTAGYVWLVLVLRLTGKRTLAKLNAFDLVVTVALGSVLATILLTSDVSWTEGATAVLTLVLLQVAVSWTSTRFARGRSVVTARPSVLLRDGRLLDDALRRNRVTASEVRQAARSSGVGGLDLVAAVVLESDGTLSVVPRDQVGDGSALRDAVEGDD